MLVILLQYSSVILLHIVYYIALLTPVNFSFSQCRQCWPVTDRITFKLNSSTSIIFPFISKNPDVRGACAPGVSDRPFLSHCHTPTLAVGACE